LSALVPLSKGNRPLPFMQLPLPSGPYLHMLKKRKIRRKGGKRRKGEKKKGGERKKGGGKEKKGEKKKHCRIRYVLP
jgi:hypothetical protein